MRRFGEWPLIKVVDTGNSALAHDLYPKALIREAARRLMTRANPDMKNLTALEIGSPSGSPPNDCHSSCRRIAKMYSYALRAKHFCNSRQPGCHHTLRLFGPLLFRYSVFEVLGDALDHPLIDDLAQIPVHAVNVAELHVFLSQRNALALPSNLTFKNSAYILNKPN